MEKISNNPLIIFDGGHNESAIQNLKQNIKQYYNHKKREYVISILKTKDHSTIIKELSEDKEAIFYFTDGIEEKPYVPAKELAKEAEKYINKDQIITDNIENVIKKVKKQNNDKVTFVIGSFYVYKKVTEIIA